MDRRYKRPNIADEEIDMIQICNLKSIEGLSVELGYKEDENRFILTGKDREGIVYELAEIKKHKKEE